MSSTMTIQEVMTPFPHAIGTDQPVSKAQDMLKELGVHHLPVQKGGKLVGILSDRDIQISRALPGGAQLKVEELMTTDPVAVLPETPVKTVVREMLKHRISCVLIHEEPAGSKPVLKGIFTQNDALKLLERLV